MTQTNDKPLFKYIKGEHSNLSDHKLVWGKLKTLATISNKTVSTKSDKNKTTVSFNYKTLNYEQLQNTTTVREYQKSLSELLIENRTPEQEKTPLP
jgi:hypothetical protein